MTIIVLWTFSASADTQSWWNARWRYRIPVEVSSGMYDRTDGVACVSLPLQELSKQARLVKGIEVRSLRVIEVVAGKHREAPCVFKKSSETDPSGVLVWQLSGKTSSMAERRYAIYFDGPGRGIEPAKYAPIAGVEAALSENVVPNAGFEEVDAKGLPTGWGQIQVTKATVGKGETTTNEAHTGQRSLHLAMPQGKGKAPMFSYHGWRSPIPARPNAKYRFSGWAKATAKPYYCLGFYFNADQWKATTTRVYKIIGGEGPNDWRQVTATAVAPADAKYIHVQLYIFRGSGDVYFDDIEVAQIPKDPLPKVTLGAIEKLP